MGTYDLISIIYANIQNLLYNFVAPCPHIIFIKFHQNPMKTKEKERNFVKILKTIKQLISTIYANIQNLLSNSVAPYPHIIHTNFHRNHSKPDGEETL